MTSIRLRAWGLPDGPNMRMVSRRCSGAIRRMRMCAMGTGMGCEGGADWVKPSSYSHFVV